MIKIFVVLCILNFVISDEIDMDMIAINVKIILYSNSQGIIYNLADFESIYDDPNFDIAKPTVLYIHGFTENRLGYTTKRIVEAYETRNDHNILSCDWGSYSRNFYLTKVLPKLYDIGLMITMNLEEFFARGYPVCEFHLVGHSLGAQVSGLIGRKLKERNIKNELCRITGLDPAGPGFYPETYKRFKHISSSDAKFVDIIHTDGGVYGALERTGTADFFPNAGLVMPGCAIIENVKGHLSGVCNHNRAVDFFAESVENPKAFVAVAAKSYEDFAEGRYDRNDVTYMGIECRIDAHSSYYLQTNAQKPFGRGCKGRFYQALNPTASFLNFISEQVQSMMKARKFVYRNVKRRMLNAGGKKKLCKQKL